MNFMHKLYALILHHDHATYMNLKAFIGSMLNSI